ncbi:NAD-dependent epimerase [Paenibacillus baekrokdamisoli]|uniref:NAD-dependent epimerase n=1 Tax=Paenibacillus baekrokdamisoli TaxID=1712516 RepID=A0A3G9J710_9BACL|nr:NAD-dependent epimerase [Paenibacillus baekrokdamisoli]MBB3067243.1 UDP-glucuronate 4-epimerase [Paenibacillus baekrokdamisoli]BBH19568.1 NAD-dependent epimerase [Paenibacillus baekrokdamisoli]
MTILVTGAAGFIGYHLSERLTRDGHSVIGIDNFNDYYDVQLKRDRFGMLKRNPLFTGLELDIAKFDSLNDLFERYGIKSVIHLAAQAGVRYSITNPFAYLDSNLVGYGNVLEACRRHSVKHLLYASSSSVYGANVKMPFSVHDSVNHPVSLYAATKKANELMAHTYSHLYGLPTTGLRFFTVYGPWGRPDMAYFSFTRDIENGTPIKVFNEGKMQRDFTFIDDIVEGIVRLLDRPPVPDPLWDPKNPSPASSYAPYRVYNIGNNKPVALMTFIRTIEKKLGKQANLEFLPMQPGDVEATFADIDDLIRDVGFKPQTTIEEGIGQFVDWYQSYFAARTTAEELLLL